VAAALAEHQLDSGILEFAGTTRTAADAARAVDARVGQIVKSLVFMAGREPDVSPLLLLVSGVNRVDEGKVQRALGVGVRKASAEEVRSATGYAIGGVPPLGHAHRLPVFVDADLLQYARLYAAAGTPQSVFPITPAALLHVSRGRLLHLKAD
jgi:prolyl-tRNA editing enzyme YbaK/EbsC (Cys-tRNA(Pro) deacylase)